MVDPRYKLTPAEVQSGVDRTRWAEGLILQLDEKHEGRNSWLMNYGRGRQAVALRQRRGLRFDEATQAAETGKSHG